MKTYAKLSLGMLTFGFFLSVLGAIVIRTQAPSHTTESISSAGPESINKTAPAATETKAEVSQTPASPAVSPAPAAPQKKLESK